MCPSLPAGVAEWQTRRIQNPLPARACGFDSLLRHPSPFFVSYRWRVMMNDLINEPSRPLPNTLNYSTPLKSIRFSSLRSKLLAWLILCVVGAPFGLLIGVVGMFATVRHLITGEGGFKWNRQSLEDWIGFAFWCATALGFIVMPTLYAVLCALCRSWLRSGDLTGAYVADRMCRWAIRTGRVLAGGLAYGLGKAMAHGRREEYIWWIVTLILVMLYLLAVRQTRRLISKECAASAAAS
jgi:hypothetical protein